MAKDVINAREIIWNIVRLQIKGIFTSTGTVRGRYGIK